MSSSNVLIVDSLSSGYGLDPIISNISFSLKYGDVFGIYGHNGSGKSTVISTLFGLCKTYKGKVLFAGKEIQNQSPNFRTKIGIRILPQNWQIFPSLTLFENIVIPHYNPYGSNNSKKLLKDIEKILQRTPKAFQCIWDDKFAGRLYHPAGELSGGERQVLSIVRLLLGKGKILLFDEPLQSLSIDLKKSVEELVISLRDEKEVIIIIVEHDLSFLQNVCTKSIVIEQGKIVAECDYQKIFISN